MYVRIYENLNLTQKSRLHFLVTSPCDISKLESAIAWIDGLAPNIPTGREEILAGRSAK